MFRAGGFVLVLCAFPLALLSQVSIISVHFVGRADGSRGTNRIAESARLGSPRKRECNGPTIFVGTFGLGLVVEKYLPRSGPKSADRDNSDPNGTLKHF